MKNLTLLCDMDSIIVNLTGKWLSLYNKDYNDTVTLDDMKSWEMADNVKIGKHIYDYLYSPNFFRHVDPIDGALEALKQLHKDGHHLNIVSAPSWPGNSASDKISWLREHMPWLSKRNIILCHNKHLVRGDIFIDDSPTNIKAYRAHWPQSKVMTIAYPYNQEVKQLCDVYALSYKDTKAAWIELYNSISQIT